MITKQQEKQIIQLLAPAKPLRIGIFGSFARDEADEQSDVDILFAPQAAIGYFQLAAIQQELERLLNRKVDLLTEGGLSQLISKQVYRDLKIIYEFISNKARVKSDFR